MTGEKDNPLTGGVYTLLLTPYNEDGSKFDPLSMSRQIDYVLDAGVNGLVACGKAGEFEDLNLDEIEQVLSHVVEHVNGRVPVGLGAISVDLDEGIKVARIASRQGASIAMVKKKSYQDLRSFFLKMADEIPVMIYDMTDNGSLDMQKDVLPIVHFCDRVVAMKVSGDVGSFDVLRKEVLSIPCLCGSDMYTLITYGTGSDGVVAGSAAVMPEREVALHKLVKEEQWDEARTYFVEKMLPMIAYGGQLLPYNYSTMKHILKWKGIIDHVFVRPPYRAAYDWHLREVEKLAQKMGIINTVEKTIGQAVV